MQTESTPTHAAGGAPPTASATPLVHIYTQNIQSLLPAGTHPCAGALPTADRLSAPNLDTVFLASDNQISLLQPIAPAHPDLRIGRQGPFASDFIPLSSRLHPLAKHSAAHVAEVQNVASRSCGDLSLREYLVGSVDSYGVGAVSRVHVPQLETEEALQGQSPPAVPASNPYSLLSTHTLYPSRRVEDGWHGIALHPLYDDQYTVASHSGKSLSLYQGEQLLQTIYTQDHPTSFKYMSAPHFREPLLVCNEGNTLSVWDVRMSNSLGQSDNISKGAVQRLQETTGALYALDTHEEGIVATGGVDKQVTVYDSRKWNVSSRWKNVLKYEIMSIQFSAFSSSYVYLSGLDHEIYCGHWGNQALNQRNLERTAFRGDARWVGLARTSDPASRRGGDQLVGLTESGQLYVLRNAHLQSGPIEEQAKKMHPNAAAAKKKREEVAAQRKERLAQGLSAYTDEEKQKRQRSQQNKAEKQADSKKRKLEDAEQASSKQ